MTLQLYNTLTRQLDPFEPLAAPRVTLYTCGPTVWNYAHIGNFRTFLFEDLLRRYLEYLGYDVFQIMNLTDVDDRTIQAAGKAGVSLTRHTEPFTRAFFEDRDYLRIKPAHVYTRATAYIGPMVELVNRLLERGLAYKSDDGSVYYAVGKFATYGRLSRLDRRELKAGARVASDEYAKDNVQDFALWKVASAEDDRVGAAWDAPFGRGRPGWHLECSAMALTEIRSRFGVETLDIHCGGVDNIFPHHENEIAQSEALTGKPFVRFWVHNEHLLVDGEKMAKSKGNFFTLRDLLDRGYGPLAVRYLLVSVPYRKQMNFTFDGLLQAQRSLERIKEFIFRLKSASLAAGSTPELVTASAEAATQFDGALDDDLNTAQALAAVFDFVRKCNIALTEGPVKEDDRKQILDFFRKVDERLAIIPPMEEFVQGDAEIESLIAQRNQARKNRDFAMSDRIRDQLLDRSVVIEDTREGTRWRRK